MGKMKEKEREGDRQRERGGGGGGKRHSKNERNVVVKEKIIRGRRTGENSEAVGRK